MVPAGLQRVVEGFRRVLADPVSDGELLDRYLVSGDSTAFDEIVGRHGPRVFAVCRRILGHYHLAEDAYQATFVVFVRKAHTIQPRSALGGFLYGIARKASTKAAIMTRRRKETLVESPPDAVAPACDPIDADVLNILDEEIANLSDTLRSAVVLCELDGVSRAVAAKQLGIAEGTLSSRLASARKQLAERLRKRGVVLSAGLFAALGSTADAVGPPILEVATAAVNTISDGVLQAMLLAKLKTTALAGVLLAFLIGLGGVVPKGGHEATAAPVPKVRAVEDGLIWTYHYKTGELTAYTPTGEKTKLLKLKEQGRLLAITPDGSKLAFLGRDGQIADRSDDKPGLTIHLRALDGKPELVDTGIAYGFRDQFLWSPDGKKLVRIRFSPNRGQAILSDIANTLIDLETKKETPLRLEHDPEQVLAWSPDGDWLLTSHYTGTIPSTVENGVRYHLIEHHRFDLKTNTSKPLGEKFQLSNCAISPDGQTLFGSAINSREAVAAGLKGLFMVRTDVATGKCTEVARHEDQSFATARWAPSGNRIAYMWYKRSSTNEAFLSIIDPDGKNPKTVTILTPGGTANEIAILGWFPASRQSKPQVTEKKDEDLIQGSWQAVAGEGDGEKAPKEALKAIVYCFKGNELTLPGDKVLTFVLDSKAKPKGLAFTVTEGPQKGMKADSAIYELNGDDLKLCIDWGRDGKAGIRPTDFKTAPRDGRISVTLKRVKEEKKDPAKQPADRNEEYAWKDTKRTRVVRTLEFGGEKVEFVKVPKGSFTMGSPESDKEAEGAEKPQHKVTFTKDLWVAKHSVTKAQFAAFVKATGYKTEAETDGKGGQGYSPPGKSEEGVTYTWKETGWEQTDQHPVVNVTWNDAVKYCEWASKESKLPVRLPTEAEYEYANRGGSDTIFQTGNDVASLVGYANVTDASAKAKLSWCKWAVSFDDGEVYTSPVGKYKPNRFGLFDMTGNVMCWCSDWSDRYQIGDVTDPASNTNGKQLYRILRGGSWHDYLTSCRAAFRTHAAPDGRTYNIGFRVVFSPSEGDAKEKNELMEERKDPGDANRILGKWVQTAFSIVPDDNTLGSGAPQRLTFDGIGMRNEITDERGERQTIDCWYELNANAKPKELTLIGKDSQSQRIYELAGDKLKIAVLSSGDRPTSFEPKDVPKGQRMIVTEFTRQIDEPKK